MTQAEAQCVLRHLDVIKELAAKGSVEYSDDTGRTWHYTETPEFIIGNLYRIKPPEPTYIPFDFGDDLMLKLVKRKDPNFAVCHSITSQGTNGVVINGDLFSYVQLLNSCLFLDNTPCGKLKQ